MVTVSIIEPPVRKTGISSSSSGRDPSTPTPSGPSILCPENATKSTPEVAHVDGQVRHRLAGVEHDEGTDGVGPLGELAHRVDGAEDVGDVGEREHLGALGEQGVEVGEVEPSVGGDRHPAQGRAGAPAGLLPRDEVGVVLHLGDEDLVAGAQREAVTVTAAATRCAVGEGVGDEVDGLGGVAREDDLRGTGTDERGDRRSGVLVGVGALLGELVRSAVNSRVGVLVEVSARRRAPAVACARWRRSRGRPAGAPAHRARQDREVGPDPGQLLVGEGGGAHHGSR
jgi:hypothetical protein